MHANVANNKVYHNGICIDWFEFTLFDSTYFDVIDLLGLSKLNIQFTDGYGQYGYKMSMRFEDITILYGGRDDMGVHVRMTGKGCRAFEKHSMIDFDQLIKGLVYLRDSVNISRIDVAYDDFEGLIDLDHIIDDVRAGNVVSRFHKGSIIESFRFDGDNVTDKTLNCGRQGSNCWITMYDKLAERKSKDIVPDCKHWVRCEIKMRQLNANRFVQLLAEGKPISELYFLVLNNYFRVVVPSATDKNRWRWEVAPYWAKFCNSVIDESISLYVAPSDDYNEYKLQKYVTVQAGAAVYTYIRKFGIKDLMKRIDDKKFKLAKKYQELLADVEAPESGSGDSCV